MTLTNFQKFCEKEISKQLKNVGKKLEKRKILGMNEKYIRAEVSDTNLTIFIYEDEAGIQSPNVDIRFETPDYRSSDVLISTFIQKILELTG